MVCFVVVGVDIGIDQVGMYGVDVNFFGGYFFGQVDGEGIDGFFGGGVVYVFIGIIQFGCY